MKKSQASNKISFLVSILLMVQILFPAINAFAAETNNNMLPPSNLSYQLLTPADVKLTWNSVFGATGYKVYEITEGQLIERGTSTTNSFTIKSLPEGQYSYVVSTLSPEGESGPCAPITVDITYPDMTAPSLTYSIQNGNDIVLSWTASQNAQNYNLYQVQSDGQTTLVKTQTTRTYTITNSPEGTYTYAVIASNSIYGESPLSAPIEVTVAYPTMTAPGNFTFTISNVNNISLKWNAASYATNYKVYQIIDGQKVLKSTVTGTTVSYTNQPAGEYVYEVYSDSSRFGESPEGSRITVTVGTVTMTAPDNLTYKLQNVNDVILTWNTVAYATNYLIYQVIDGQKVLKSTVTGTTITYTNQPAGDYLYEVHSYSDRFGESVGGSQVSLTVSSVVMAPPAAVTYTLQNVNDVVLTWGTATYANSYKVYQVIDGQKVLLSTVTGTTVTYANQPAGDYVYEVHSFSTRFGESLDGTLVNFTLDSVTMAPPGNLNYKLQNVNDIILTWTASANANNYKVYQIINGQKVLKSTVTGTTVTYINQPAGEYVYEVHSNSTRFGESPEGSQISFTLGAVTMVPPADFTYNLQNINYIVLTWSTAANANGYKIYQITNGQKVLKSTLTGTTITYANQPAGNYVYEIHSYSDRFGESSEGSQVTLTIEAVIIAAPENFQYTLLNGNDIKLTWDAVVDANSYKVYQITNGQKVLKSTVTGTTVTYANQPQGNYTYEVHSFSTRFGESPEGSQVTFPLIYPTMEPPTTLVQTIKNATDFSLTWDASTYATSYKVYQILNGQKVLKSTVAGLTVTYTGMTPGEYTYEVHSVSPRFGESPEGTQLTMTLDGQTMQAPANPTYSIANGNDITLKWMAVPYATSYKIYQVVDGQKTLKNTITGTSITYVNQPEGPLNYEIHSFSTILGESPEGAEIAFTLVYPTVAAPGNFAYKVQNGNDIVLTWGAVTFGNSYNVYELVNGQKVLKNSVTTLYVIQRNVLGGDHTYIVHAVSSRFGESPEGSQVTLTLDSPIMQAPGNFTMTFANGNDITLKWNSVTYATAYNLYQLVDGNEVLVKTQTGTTITLTNQPEDDYTYVVRSYSDEFGESPEGSELAFALIWPIMQAPGSFTQSVANGNDITLVWNKVTYASGYKLYQIIDGQEVLIKTQAGTTISLPNQPEDDYTYMVRSYSSRFGDSAAGSELKYTLVWPTMQAPANFTKTIANGNDITLRWNTVTYASGYKLYQIIDGQEVLMKTQTGTIVTLTNQPEDDYNYVVRSYSSRFGDSPAGSELKFTLEWPIVQSPVLTGTVFNANNITFSWSAASWANEYRLYDLTGGTRELIYKGTARTYKLYNLSEATHSYEVAAYNTRFGESVPSNRITEMIIFPVMQPPVASINLLSDTSARISWNFVTYSNGYNVFELIDGNPVLLTENLNNLSFTISDLSYKNHEYYVTSYSNSFGESEPSNTVLAKLIIDTEAPVTSAEAPTGWTNHNQVVTLSATDNETGVANTFYSLNDGEYTAGTSVMVDQEGVNKVSFYSVDNVGNIEVAHTVEVRIDRTAPVTVSDAPAVWSKEDVTVKLTATDAQSGTAQTFYSIDDSAYAEGSSFTISDEGIHQVTFYSLDTAGNIETANTVVVKIDKTAPVITMNLTEEYQAGSTLQLTYSAVDTLSGIVTDQMTVISPNGTTEVLEQNSGITLENPGVYTVTVIVTNAAGLSTTMTKQFVAYIKSSITVTPNVIKGNKGVFTVRVDLPNGYSSEGIDLNTATLNGVKALNSNNGYYNQAKLGQFKFERSDFDWTAAEVTLHFRGYVNGILVIGETTVKVQK